MKNYMLKFRPFAHAYIDDMTIQAESLLKAADEFKKAFPKGRIIEIQPEEAVMLEAFGPSNVIYGKFEKQPSRMSEGEVGELIHVDFKLRKKIT